jgi:hypothetical protein
MQLGQAVTCNNHFDLSDFKRARVHRDYMVSARLQRFVGKINDRLEMS